MGVNPRSVQEWEAGTNRPGAQRLQALLEALLGTNGLTVGQEQEEAEALWAAVLREATRMHAPFDPDWFTSLLTARTAPELSERAVGALSTASQVPIPGRDLHQDWGEAPDVSGFVGRAEELAAL
jgi:hypothetical protein